MCEITIGISRETNGKRKYREEICTKSAKQFIENSEVPTEYTLSPRGNYAPKPHFLRRSLCLAVGQQFNYSNMCFIHDVLPKTLDGTSLTAHYLFLLLSLLTKLSISEINETRTDYYVN